MGSKTPASAFLLGGPSCAQHPSGVFKRQMTNRPFQSTVPLVLWAVTSVTQMPACTSKTSYLNDQSLAGANSACSSVTQ